MTEFPNIGQNVNLVLTSGGTAIGYWDGLQWWVGVDGQPSDVPIVNSYIESWSPIT